MTSSFSDRTSRGFLAFYINRASLSIEKQTERILQNQCNLTVQQWWIICDVTAEGYLRMEQLEGLSSVTMPDVWQDVAVLEERGLLTVIPDRSDPRINTVETTEAGKGVYQEILKTMRIRDEQLSWGISAEKIETLLEILAEIEDVSNRPIPIEDPKTRATFLFGNSNVEKLSFR